MSGRRTGEQPEGVPLAPGDELAQVERVGVAGQAPVTGEEPGQCEALGVGEIGVDRGGGG